MSHMQCSFNRNYHYAFGPRFALAYQIGFRRQDGTPFGFRSDLRNGPESWEPDAERCRFLHPWCPGIWIDQICNCRMAIHLRTATSLVTRRSSSRILARSILTKSLPLYGRLNRHHLDRPECGKASSSNPTGASACRREVMPNLMVEAAYVGNRGVWWTAPLLAKENYNSLTPESLKATWGLDITNAADRALLTLRFARHRSSPGSRTLRIQTVSIQDFHRINRSSRRCGLIRQWIGIPPFLGTRARRHLVRFAAGKSDPAVLARIDGTSGLHLAERISARHRHGHVLPGAG